MTHSGGKPHNVGDKGQRYAVSFFDPGNNERRPFGYSDDVAGALAMAQSIHLHPSMSKPVIVDRQKESDHYPAFNWMDEQA